jgi:hydrogenase expression/formation protein HypC
MPGKVIAIQGTRATVDFSGNTVEANAGLVMVKIGDYVLVHAGCILQVLSKEEGDTLTDLFCEIGVQGLFKEGNKT